MRTKEELEVLYKKFDRDVQKRTRFMRAVLAFDQLCNVIFWNGSQDETISSHIARKKRVGTATWFDNKVCCFLNKFEYNHCELSLGE